MSAEKLLKQIPVTEITSQKNQFDNSLEAIRSRHSQELIVGLCGAVGAGVKRLKNALVEELTKANYQVEHIRLSDLICSTQNDSEQIKALSGYERYEKLQDLGDKLRSENSHTTVADMGIRRISLIRNSLFGNNEAGKAVKITKKVAYIVDQIKHHEEVELFQEVYKNNFYLLGLLRTQAEREQNLKDENLSILEITKLIERDRNSNDKYGQHVEKAIEKSDYFIRNLDELEELEKSISRFVKLIHGVGNITSKRDERGLYSAYSASLASACLSRQVGAAIMDEHGQIVSTGCNDVPTFKGGLYDADSSSDKRCYNKGGCHNDKHKRVLKDQMKDILQSEGVEEYSRVADVLFNNSKAKALIEYSRSIHAEMDAILALARNTSSGTMGKTLYCTTYPCHNCARHIIAAGIEKVVYIEPYEKSLAMDLHNDALCHVDTFSENKVVLQNFEGVSPQRYADFFIYNKSRKDAEGNPTKYQIPNSSHVDPQPLDCYVDYETKIIDIANVAVGDDLFTNT